VTKNEAQRSIRHFNEIIIWMLTNVDQFAYKQRKHK